MRRQRAEDRFEEALAAYEDGQLNMARRGLEQALAEFEAMGDLGYVGMCCHWLGQISDLLDQWQQALDYYDRSLAAYRAIGDRQGEGATLGSQALIFMYRSQFPKARDVANRALAISQDIGDRQGEEASLGNLGLIHAEMGDYETALGYYQQSLAIARQIGERADEAATLHDIAELCYHTGAWQQCEHYFNDALRLREAIGDDVGRVHTLQSWGLLCQSKGAYGRSLELYHEALTLGEGLEMPGQKAATLNNLALTYTLLNRDEDAVKLLEQGRVYFESVDDQPRLGIIDLNLGVTHSRLGYLEMAERYLISALKTHRATGSTYFLALTLAYLGSHYHRKRQPQKGLPMVEESLQLFGRMNDREGLGLAYNLSGALHEALGDPAHALADYQASLVIQEAIADREGLRITLSNLGRFHEEVLAHLELARSCYRCAIAILEGSRADLERGVHRLTYMRDKFLVYERLALLAWMEGKRLAAWEAMEGMRARHLVDLLATAPIKPPANLPSRWQQEENKLLAQLRRLLNQRFGVGASQPLSFASEISRLETQLKATWQEMEKVAPDYVSFRQSRPLAWRDLREVLAI